MNITMTVGELHSLYEALITLQQETELKLPIKVGYKILRNLRSIESIYQATETLRLNIIRTYGELNGDSYTFSEENLVAANKDLQELYQTKEEVNIDKIHISDISDVLLPLADLSGLYPIIEGDI